MRRLLGSVLTTRYLIAIVTAFILFESLLYLYDASLAQKSGWHVQLPSEYNITSSNTHIIIAQTDLQSEQPASTVEEQSTEQKPTGSPKVTKPEIAEDIDPLFTPEAVQDRFPQYKIQKRDKRVKVIDSFPFNKELDFLELRLNVLKDVVDYHILAESMWTQHGDPKPLYFNESKHRFKDWEHKLIHVIVDVRPDKVEGWENEIFLRDCIAAKGLPLLEKRTTLHDDDVFMVFDMDELPRPQSVRFLSEYKGYPASTKYCLRWTYYGFFYINPNPTCITAVVSMHDLIHTLKNQSNGIRANSAHLPQWSIDAPNARAGWHCSWCFLSFQDYVNKLTSALSGDGTRWGDFPEKKQLEYIKENREKARWFDGSSDGRPVARDDPYLAPKYALDHFDLYGFILDKNVKTPPHNNK